MACVYVIRNTVDGMVYVGSTKTSLKERWYRHERELDEGNHPCPPLQKAWGRYGRDAFIVETIEEIPLTPELVALHKRHREELSSAEKTWVRGIRDAEQAWLDSMRPYERDIGYNVNASSMGPVGRKFTDAHKKLIGDASRGRTHGAEVRKRMSLAKKESPIFQAAVARGNARKRILSDADVMVIVKLRNDGLSQDKVAAQLGVSRRVVRAIMEGHTYNDVTGIAHVKPNGDK